MARNKAHSADYLAQMKRLIANWPVDDDRGAVLLDEFAGIWNEVGENRFRRAVDSILADSDYRFFPNQAEFRGHLPSSEHKPLCKKCKSGWISVPDHEARRLYGNPEAMCMIRCECRGGAEAHRRILEGQWKWPL